MSLVSPYLSAQIDKFPRLSPARTKALIARAQAGDKAAKDLVVNSNLRLVLNFAKRYQGYTGLELDDFMSEGVIGLLRAIDLYDSSKGFAFSTYASSAIGLAMLRFLDQNQRTIKIPVKASRELGKIAKAEGRLADPSAANLALATGIPLDRVEDLLAIRETTSSYGDDGSEFGEIIPDPTTDVADEVIGRLEAEEVHEALKSLPDYWREVVVAAYGLSDGIPRSFREIGHDQEVSVAAIAEVVEKSTATLYRYYQGEVSEQEIRERQEQSDLARAARFGKVCNKCGKWKYGTHFARRVKNGKEGLQPVCKLCKAEIDKKYAPAKVARKAARRKLDPNYGR